MNFAGAARPLHSDGLAAAARHVGVDRPGFNAGLAGFRDAQEMVSQMMRSENEQILAMA